MSNIFCAFCNRSHKEIPAEESIVQSSDKKTYICHSCIVKSQAVLAAHYRKKNWSTRTSLKLV